MEIFSKPPTTLPYTHTTLNTTGESLKRTGESLIRANKLCVIILAGGQGTRLGSDDPKGMYELPEIKMSLFEIHLGNIRRINKIYNCSIKVVVMTSVFTHKKTVKYFERHGYFGIAERDVFFMHQGSSICFSFRDVPLPFELAKDKTKKIDDSKDSGSKKNKYSSKDEYGDVNIYDDGRDRYNSGTFSPTTSSSGTSSGSSSTNNKSCTKANGYPDLTPKFAVSPSGNGEVFKLMYEKDVYKFLDGIEYCNVISVDNVLARVCDPVFLGFMSTNKLDAGCKSVVRKGDENVGVFIQRGENVIVREYCELEKNHLKTDSRSSINDGKTSGDSVDTTKIGSEFDQGNICNHMFSIEFMKRMGTINLPAHKAYKKIPFTDKQGKLVKPTKNNGYKNELFIFDCLEYTKKTGVMNVPRELEFSPVKNGLDCSTDTPLTAVFVLYERSKIMLENAGARVGHWKVLVMPDVSVFGEGLERFKGKVFEKDEIIRE